MANKKAISTQFMKKTMIEMGCYSFSNSLYIECMNLKPVGPVGAKYQGVASAFAGAPEYSFLALHQYDVHVSKCD